MEDLEQRKDLKKPYCKVEVNPPNRDSRTPSEDYEVQFNWKLKIKWSTCANYFTFFLLIAVVSHNYFELMQMRNRISYLEASLERCTVRNGDLPLPWEFPVQDPVDPLGEYPAGSADRAKRDTLEGEAASVNSSVIAVHLVNHKTVVEARKKSEIVQDWYDSSRGPTSKFFSITSRAVTVDVPGLYWIYAQLYYIQLQNEGGFDICLQDRQGLSDPCKVIARCTASKTSDGDNTCFTGAAISLKTGDVIYIRLLHLGRRMNFGPGNCFFGLVRLGD